MSGWSGHALIADVSIDAGGLDDGERLVDVMNCLFFFIIYDEENNAEICISILEMFKTFSGRQKMIF